MKLITIAGPPSCGKTSVILRTLEPLVKEGKKTGVVKFDCLTSDDHKKYEKAGIIVKTGLSGGLCPDHFFISNIEEALKWGIRNGMEFLITESAGLCNRCSPHIKEIPAICVIDQLSGVHTPRKIGPMLKNADIAVLTKGDVISQAEREIFTFRVRQVNPKAAVLPVNGLTGQGTMLLRRHFDSSPDVKTIRDKRLRFTMPAALCSYCLGETKIGEDSQIGNIRTMDFS